MKSKTDKITDTIVRISVTPAGAFSYNKFLLLGDRPMLIHTGRQHWFDETRARLADHIDPASLAAVTFSHFEGDECGALNEVLAAAPAATVYVGARSMKTVEDYCSRRPVVVPDRQAIDLGSRRLILIETPHFPHNWDSCLFYEPDEKVLFCSDMGANNINGRLFMDREDIDKLIRFQHRSGYLNTGSHLRAAIDTLRTFEIDTLAIHHGASIRGRDVVHSFFDRLVEEFG